MNYIPRYLSLSTRIGVMLALIIAIFFLEAISAAQEPPSPATVFSFDGHNNFLVVPRSAKLEPEQITIELWVCLSGTQGQNARLIRKVGEEPHSGYILAASQAGFPNLQIRYGNPMTVLSDSWQNRAYTGQWHHIAAVICQDAAVLYIDGDAISSVRGQGEPLQHDNEAPLVIGAEGFQGRLAEIRIWSTARSQSSIRSLMHKRLSGHESDLLAYWPLDDASGDKAQDRSAHAHDAMPSLWRNQMGTSPQVVPAPDLPIENPRIITGSYSRYCADQRTQRKSEELEQHQTLQTQKLRRNEQLLKLPKLNRAIVETAESMLETQVGKGDCWEFVNTVMQRTGARRKDIYVFGERVERKLAMPGDIIQFGKWSCPSFGTTHHTAIIDDIDQDGRICLIHSNAPPGGHNVSKIWISNSGNEGDMTVYRPIR